MGFGHPVDDPDPRNNSLVRGLDDGIECRCFGVASSSQVVVLWALLLALYVFDLRETSLLDARLWHVVPATTVVARNAECLVYLRSEFIDGWLTAIMCTVPGTWYGMMIIMKKESRALVPGSRCFRSNQFSGRQTNFAGF